MNWGSVNFDYKCLQLYSYPATYNSVAKGSTMKKPDSDYQTETDKVVLATPDHFLIRVFQHGQGWVDSVPFNAKDAFERYENIVAMGRNYRMSLNAVKKLEGQDHLVPITPKRLAEFARAAG